MVLIHVAVTITCVGDAIGAGLIAALVRIDSHAAKCNVRELDACNIDHNGDNDDDDDNGKGNSSASGSDIDSCLGHGNAKKSGD